MLVIIVGQRGVSFAHENPVRVYRSRQRVAALGQDAADCGASDRKALVIVPSWIVTVDRISLSVQVLVERQRVLHVAAERIKRREAARRRVHETQP
jgi:hypothetical protein